MMTRMAESSTQNRFFFFFFSPKKDSRSVMGEYHELSVNWVSTFLGLNKQSQKVEMKFKILEKLKTQV